MGLPITEQYQQQSIEVLTPEVHVVATGDDPVLLWTAGVVVPLLIAAMGIWFQRSHMRKRKEKDQ